MEGNGAAFPATPQIGKQWVLNKAKVLLYDTNWHEDTHEELVALSLQGKTDFIVLEKNSCTLQI